ncbi:MAG: SRPBCC family protein [Verrucomicrobiota bacterium]|nr:SRPBCC family protein [Verrucomicrobiota bacterium]
MKSRYFPLLGALGFLLVFPFFLSRKTRVLRRKIIRAAPAEVFPFINDLRNWPRWTEWNRRDDFHFTYDGPPSGIGATQRWENSRGDGSLKVVQSVENERVTYDLEMNRGKYHLEGLIALEPLGAVTRVSWLCKWQSGTNPYNRYRDLFFKVVIGRDFEAGLENLKGVIENQRVA